MKEQIFYKAIVVSNKDPEDARRVRVRVIGIHPLEGEAEYNLVPDESLPWALPNISITEGKNNGKFGKFDVPDEGDIVRVFFEDSAFQRPVYFGIVTTLVDKNENFKQGENSVFVDRWNNMFQVDNDEIKIIKNNNSAIRMHNDFIQIKTKEGNQINLNDKDSEITIIDSNNNKIETNKDKMILTFSNGEYIKIEKGSISLGTPNDSDVSVLGNALMWWLGLHTHTSSAPTFTTSPPNQVGDLQNILKSSVAFKPSIAVPDMIAATQEEKDAEQKSLEERGGEENISFAVKQESDYADNKAIVQPSDTEQKEELQQREAIRQVEVENIDKGQETTFDQKYPIRSKPFANSTLEADFNSKLANIHPKIVSILREAITRYNFVITSGYRSPEHQYELYKQKLTPCDGFKRKSLHNRMPCPCIDISPRPGTISDLKAVNELKEVMMEIAKRQGVRLRWLGDVVMPNGSRDFPHYELFNGIG